MEAHAQEAPAPRWRRINLCKSAAAILAIAATVEVVPPVARGINEVVAQAKVTLQRDTSAKDDRTFTMEQLRAMPNRRTVIAQNGDGILDIISRANTVHGRTDDIFSDGPALNAEYDYIKAQEINGTIQRGQHVQVPLIRVIRKQP
ncbi:MAG TPA: hypothetical protein VHB72_00660 [Candidatus Saccharimonadales bacterium]|nr:hypothetical protein [Candidatus Saccharimonadales bacterium]